MPFLIILIIVLILIGLYFYFENKKLKQKIETLELETKIILERKLRSNKEDLVSINNLSIEEDVAKEKIKVVTKKEEKKHVSSKPLPKLIPAEKYTARTNLVEYQKPKIQKPTETILTKNEHKPASQKPIKKNKEDIQIPKIISITKDFDPIDFIKKETKLSKEDNQKDDYIKNIAKQLEEEIIPQTINLTDYEKNEEEQAIISYQELLSLKEQSKNQDSKDKSFLEELKTLRSLLDSKH